MRYGSRPLGPNRVKFRGLYDITTYMTSREDSGAHIGSKNDFRETPELPLTPREVVLFPG